MTQKNDYPKEFLELIKSITNKRAKIVIDHIMKNGFITTEDLDNYGYKHAPRAARDVREAGIPLITFNVKSTEGKSIAAYKFDDLTKVQGNRSAGRVTLPKQLKRALYSLQDDKCAICNASYEERYLQVDHRVPYQVGGDLKGHLLQEDFMAICGSCNRSKSWSCEHCENWQEIKSPEVCMKCYWGNPENYNHVAMEEMRRIDLTWYGPDVKYYDAVKLIAAKHEIELPEFIKAILAKASDEMV